MQFLYLHNIKNGLSDTSTYEQLLVIGEMTQMASHDHLCPSLIIDSQLATPLYVLTTSGLVITPAMVN
jgi:hypothetical protein